MLQTLYRIPLSGPWPITGNWSLPGFGPLGVPMLLWVLFGIAWLVQQRREWKSRQRDAQTGRPEPPSPQRESGTARLLPAAGVWLAVAAVIALLPQFGWTQGRSIPIYGWGLMLFVGLMAAGYDAARRARRVGVNPEIIWDLALGGFFAGIVGARLFYIVEYRERVFAHAETFGQKLLAAVNLPDGGMVFYGGVILGAGTFIGLCRLKRVSALLLADVAIPSLFIGLAFGRIGCFLNGCCYGGRCDWPWGVTFPPGSVPFEVLRYRGLLPPDAAATYPLHPTQLYSSLGAAALAFVTAACFRRRTRDGAVLGLALFLYPLGRFLMEFVRNDEPGQFHTPLTIAQWVSLFLLAAGLFYTVWLVRTRKQVTPYVAAPATQKPVAA